jgi:hypothetical protein
MRSYDDYERLRTAFTELALGQSNALDRERWLALAIACAHPDQSKSDAGRCRSLAKQVKAGGSVLPR